MEFRPFYANSDAPPLTSSDDVPEDDEMFANYFHVSNAASLVEQTGTDANGKPKTNYKIFGTVLMYSVIDPQHICDVANPGLGREEIKVSLRVKVIQMLDTRQDYALTCIHNGVNNAGVKRVLTSIMERQEAHMRTQEHIERYGDSPTPTPTVLRKSLRELATLQRGNKIEVKRALYFPKHNVVLEFGTPDIHRSDRILVALDHAGHLR